LQTRSTPGWPPPSKLQLLPCRIVTFLSSFKIDEFRSQELTKIAVAFSTSGCSARHAPLFDIIAAESRKKIGSFYPPDLEKMAKAFADAGYEAPVKAALTQDKRPA